MLHDTRHTGATVSSNVTGTSRPARLAGLFVVALALVRLAHAKVLWADEDYHLAAAINVLHGLIPYRDFWYDKPPLAILYYVLIGGFPGWPLRLLDAAYVATAAVLLYRLARTLWSEWEGLTAALLFAFFMTFYLPSAVIPLAADALMIVPHVGAVYCAIRGKPLLAGAWAGVAFLVNTKAVFVLAACAVWVFPEALQLAAGFAIVPTITTAVIIASGAWPGYLAQVWRWGFAYAAASPELHPYRNGLIRTIHWLSFHAALAVAAMAAILNRDRHTVRVGLWIVFSFLGVVMGWRFEPRYFLQLLPPLTILASRGAVLLVTRYHARAGFAVAALLIVPFIRFGPRYLTMEADAINGRIPRWTDLAIDEDSAQAAAQLNRVAHRGETLLVWGYRPDIYVYTRMVPAGRFWDSQPLTGVPADRHLHSPQPILPAADSAANRRELTRFQPAYLVDSLSLYNPALRLDEYPELRAWFAHYREIGRTAGSVIYARR